MRRPSPLSDCSNIPPVRTLSENDQRADMRGSPYESTRSNDRRLSPSNEVMVHTSHYTLSRSDSQKTTTSEDAYGGLAQEDMTERAAPRDNHFLSVRTGQGIHWGCSVLCFFGVGIVLSRPSDTKMPATATAHTAREILRRVLAGRTAYDSQRVLFRTDSEDWDVCRGLRWVMTER